MLPVRHSHNPLVSALTEMLSQIRPDLQSREIRFKNSLGE
jgi:hypothetical protein